MNETGYNVNMDNNNDDYIEIAERYRKKAIKELHLLLSIVNDNKRDFKYAFKYVIIKAAVDSGKPFSKLRLKLLTAFTYGYYYGAFPTVSECARAKDILKERCSDFLDEKYWNTRDISYLIRVLQRRRVYTVKQAVYLLEYKRSKRK